MENYETLGIIGEGTYGVVMRARHRETGQVVAIKKFKESDEDEQVRKTSLREVRVLKQLRHDNIITLLEVFRRKGKLYLVFEYVEKTILEVLETRANGLDEADVRRYTYQLLRGTEYCHAHNVMHRDIKPENILISKNGTLKLCDFGFARTMSIGGKYTDYVATRWYRGPELLVGDVEYTKGVDIWAIGCIFSEISTGMPLFPGESDVDQLAHVMRCAGRLTTRQVQTFRRNPLYVGVELPNPKEQETLDMMFPHMPKPWLQFLKCCLKNDPEQRESCTSLMNLPYFTDNGFRSDFEHELRMLFEKEQKQLQGIGNRAAKHSSKDSAAAHVSQLPDAPLANPLRSETPAVAAPPAINQGKQQAASIASTSNNKQGPPTVPSIGSLWSQYLASTSTSASGQTESLPDLGTKVHALQTQHPLFAAGAAHQGLYYRNASQDPIGPTDPLSQPPPAKQPSPSVSSTMPASNSYAHHFHTQPATNPSLTMTSTGVNRGYVPPSSSQQAQRTMFPSLATSGNANVSSQVATSQPPPPSVQLGANPSLGLYKKKPASKKNVLSTLNFGAYGNTPGGGSSSPPPAGPSFGANPYAFGVSGSGGSGMVLQGHHTGTAQPPQSQQGPRKTAKSWMS